MQACILSQHYFIERARNSGPEAYRRLKELCEVFAHPITKVWNRDLAWKVVDIMDALTVSYNVPVMS